MQDCMDGINALAYENIDDMNLIQMTEDWYLILVNHINVESKLATSILITIFIVKDMQYFYLRQNIPSPLRMELIG